MDSKKKRDYLLIDGSEGGGGGDGDYDERDVMIKSPDSMSDYSLFNFKNHKVSTLTFNNKLKTSNSESISSSSHFKSSSSAASSSSSSIIPNISSKKTCADYTIAGRTQQHSRFSKYYYHQVGTFLTQYKIRENYKFLQMISVPPLDPLTPKPEGAVSVPACGEPLLVPHSFPQSIEAAIHKFANASSKATCITVVDHNGKPISSLTYGNFFNRIFLMLASIYAPNIFLLSVKLLTRAQRVAYQLLNKSAVKGEQCLKFGDRVGVL